MSEELLNKLKAAKTPEEIHQVLKELELNRLKVFDLYDSNDEKLEFKDISIEEFGRAYMG